MMGGLAPTGTSKWRAPKFPSCWRARSNDQCEQFNDAYSDHQHGKCYRVVIEPMRPLYIHRRPLSVPRFELLDECSDMRGHRRRQSVILGPEAVPNRQPNASINSGKYLAVRSTTHPRSMRAIQCRPEIRRSETGCVDTPTDPVIDPICCSNHGYEPAARLSR